MKWNTTPQRRVVRPYWAQAKVNANAKEGLEWEWDEIDRP
jgi:hypothetical protein